jgi:ParB family chromosome partitioning protein
VRQLMENIQREDLNDVDRAEALQALKTHLGNPAWEVVAEKVGIKRSRLFQLLDVKKQPAAIQEDIRAGRLSEKHSRALQSAPEAVREELHRAALDRQLSGAETLHIARQAQHSPPGWTIERAVVELRDKPKAAPPVTPTAPLIEVIGSPASQAPTVQAASTPEKSPPGWTVALNSALSGLQSALDTFDPAAADVETLRTLLSEIVAKATALLALLSETAAATAATDVTTSPAPPRT